MNILSLLLLLLVCYSTEADYNCLCNYNVERVVYSSTALTGDPVGYLYEFDCKASIPELGKSDGSVVAIQFEHKIGYVELNAQTQVQTCPGEISTDDLVPTTTTTPPLTITSFNVTTVNTVSTLPTTSPRTTQVPTTQTTPTTTRLTPLTTTTKLTTRTTTTMPTTFSTTLKTTTQTTTPIPTTETTTRIPTTKSTTKIPTTKTTTPIPTTKTTTQFPTTKTTTQKPTTKTTTLMLATKTTTQIPITKTATQSPTTVTQKPKLEGHTEMCPPHVQTDKNNFHGFLGQYGEYCYELVGDPHARHSAQVHCGLNAKGLLLEIYNKDVQLYIERFLSRHEYVQAVWIGLKDKDTEGTLEWNSGKAVTYTNFKDHYNFNSPSHHKLDDCFVLEQGGEWNDVPCGILEVFGEKHPFICQYYLNSTRPSLNEIPGQIVG